MARKNTKALIKAAKLAERSVLLCLQPDLTAALQNLQRELAEAERREQSAGSLGGGELHDIAQRIEDTRLRMREHSLEVTVRALPRRQWTALLAEHPPREDNERDRTLGLNEETFFDALVRRSTIAPDLDEDDWSQLDEVLSEAQWQLLVNAAWAVNARDVDVPFSLRASQILASSATG